MQQTHEPSHDPAVSLTLRHCWAHFTQGENSCTKLSTREKLHPKGKNKHIFKDISFNWHLFSTFFISLFPTLQDTLKDQFLLLPICPWEIFTEILVSASSSSCDRCLCMFLLYFYFLPFFPICFKVSVCLFIFPWIAFLLCFGLLAKHIFNNEGLAGAHFCLDFFQMKMRYRYFLR